MKTSLSHLFTTATYASIIALLCLSLVVLPTVGCVSSTTIAGLAQTLGTAAANIAAIEGNSTLGQKISIDTAAAVVAITNWKAGTSAQDAIEALSIVEDDLNLIPNTSQYAPLIDLAIGTVQTLLGLLPPSTVATARVHRNVTLSHPAPKNAAAFKKQWNGIIAANPNLAPALLR